MISWLRRGTGKHEPSVIPTDDQITAAAEWGEEATRWIPVPDDWRHPLIEATSRAVPVPAGIQHLRLSAIIRRALMTKTVPAHPITGQGAMGVSCDELAAVILAELQFTEETRLADDGMVSSTWDRAGKHTVRSKPQTTLRRYVTPWLADDPNICPDCGEPFSKLGPHYEITAAKGSHGDH